MTINLDNNTINANEILSIHVSYGKQRRFISAHYVEAEALDAYIAKKVKSVKDPDKLFIVENGARSTKWNGTGNYGKILCFTTEGFEYDYKVKY